MIKSRLDGCGQVQWTPNPRYQNATVTPSPQKPLGLKKLQHNDGLLHTYHITKFQLRRSVTSGYRDTLPKFGVGVRCPVVTP